MTSSDKNVIIPRFTKHGGEQKYFTPRYIKIVKGETIEWINFDIKPHTLVFLSIKNKQDIKQIDKLGPIEPQKSKKKIFDYKGIVRIDYYCENHGNEIGSIVIYPKPEEQMSNTEQLRFLTRAFNIDVPESLKHLKS